MPLFKLRRSLPTLTEPVVVIRCSSKLVVSFSKITLPFSMTVMYPLLSKVSAYVPT
jgi:hypothetical protein